MGKLQAPFLRPLAQGRGVIGSGPVAVEADGHVRLEVPLEVHGGLYTARAPRHRPAREAIRSGRPLRRLKTVLTSNILGSSFAVTSFQSSGVDTVAPGVARTT